MLKKGTRWSTSKIELSSQYIKYLCKFVKTIDINVELLIKDKLIICPLGNLHYQIQEKNSNLNRDSNQARNPEGRALCTISGIYFSLKQIDLDGLY